MDNMPVRCVNVKSEQVDPSHVALAVDAIRAGKLVALPTETVYGIAAIPGDAASEDRVRQMKGRDPARPMSFHVATPADAAALTPRMPPGAARLASRYWPGPLTIVVDGHQDMTVGIRVPANPFTQEVLAAFDQGLLLSSVNRSGHPPLLDADSMANEIPELDLIFDGGRPPLALSSAVVRCVGSSIEVLREGTLDRMDLLVGAAAALVFVCTGNTCRSPMAEAIARRRIADELGVNEDELLQHGLLVSSAGTMAAHGIPATDHAIQAAREIGLDLTEHRSTPTHGQFLDEASRVYALTGSHLMGLLRERPELNEIASTLRPDGQDIDDPFGADLAVYRSTRDAIAAAVDQRCPDIMAWVNYVTGVGRQSS